MPPRLPLLATSLALVACAAPTPSQCVLIQDTSIPVTFASRNLPIADITIGSKTLHMIIDTGASSSLITQAAEQTLHAAYVSGVSVKGEGLNGAVQSEVVTVWKFQIGDITVENEAFFIASLDPAHNKIASTADGVIGEDFLNGYNLALDFPHDRLGLFKRGGRCDGRLPVERRIRLSRLQFRSQRGAANSRQDRWPDLAFHD